MIASPEFYIQAAETCLDQADEVPRSKGELVKANLIAMAQVNATLAVASAIHNAHEVH